MKNKIIYIMIFVVLVFGLSGCFLKKDSMLDKAIKYMEDKYNDKFIYKDSFGGSSKNLNALLIAEKAAGEITVTVNILEDGKIRYTDNYVARKYESETYDFLFKLAKRVFGSQVKICRELSSLGRKNDFSDKTTFEEYIKNKNSDISFSIMVGPDYLLDEEKAANDLKEELEKTGLYFDSLEVYFAPSYEMFKEPSEVKYFEKKQYKIFYANWDFKTTMWY